MPKTRTANRTQNLAWPKSSAGILILAAAALAIAAFVFVWLSRASDSSKKNLNTYTVKRGSLLISVTESGDIKAINTEDIKSEVEGKTTIISIVDEGTIITPNDVNTGKVLVELDSSELEQKLTQQEVQFLSAEASFTDANESLEIQKKQNESDIKKGQMKVKFALMDLHKYVGAVVGQKLISAMENPGIEPNEIISLVNEPSLAGEALQKLRELNDNITLAESKFEQKSDELMWTKLPSIKFEQSANAAVKDDSSVDSVSRLLS